jgi:hypothetical protein
MEKSTESAGIKILDEILEGGHLIGFTHEAYLAHSFVQNNCDAVGLSVNETTIRRLVDVIREVKDSILGLITFKEYLCPYKKPTTKDDREFIKKLLIVRDSIAERINQELLTVSHA